jgi:hypothetical protein
MVEWSVQKWRAGTSIVERSVKKEGLEPTLSNDQLKIKAGTDIVDSLSHFPVIGA